MNQPIDLEAPAGFDFRRTVLSHGWCALAPFHLDRESFVLTRVMRLPSGRVVRAALSEFPGGGRGRRGGPGRAGRGRRGGPGRAVRVMIAGRPLSAKDRAGAIAQASLMLRLDEDLGPFYALASSHDSFRWIPQEGAGRLLRSPTVYEDLVKLICTTNCTWALTEVMTRNLVAALGESADGAGQRAFATPEAMAKQGEAFYTREIRAGYRAAALAELAERVASGRLNVEAWADGRLSTEELTRLILSVRGAGRYTAENLLKLLGRYEGLALDSWCRAKFTQMYGASGRRGGTPARSDARAPRAAVPANGKSMKRSEAGRTPKRAGAAAGKIPAANKQSSSGSGTKALPEAGVRGRPRRLAPDTRIAKHYERFGVWRGLALWCDLTKSWLEGPSATGGAGDKF